jgi:hypothetical protein
MSVNAVAVELLIDKGGFEPRVALGIAEAIETSMTQAQIVTIPVLDTRVVQLEAKIDTRFAQFEAKVDTQFAQFEAKVDTQFAQFEARVDTRFAQLEVKVESVKAELVRWVFAAMLGNAVLSAIAAALLNAYQHSR